MTGKLPTYLHTYIHTYMHAYIHACIHTYMHAYIHTRHTYIMVVGDPQESRERQER